MTVTTRSDKPGYQTFWFGRADMKDNLRPTQVEARDGVEAWKLLEEQEKAKCST
jgi:hypothetical protein